MSAHATQIPFFRNSAEIFVPDGRSPEEALQRTTHLCLCAHADDSEFMAFPGILECHDSETEWFTAVVCTDGAGSARTGSYSTVSREELVNIRREEQKHAALLGKYSAAVLLDHPSASLLQSPDQLTGDLETILKSAKAGTVYLHNPADKHPTHIAVFAASLLALRRLPENHLPRKVLGCEGWRSLDWMNVADAIHLDVSGHDDLAKALTNVFASQVEGGKRYDTALLGRRAAHATFWDPHAADTASQVCLAMDLTPLLDPDVDPVAFTLGHIDAFRKDVADRLASAFSQTQKSE